MRSPVPQLTGALLLSLAAPQLSGCAAAALVPLMAGGTLTGKAVADRAKPDEKPVTPVVIVGKDPVQAPQQTRDMPELAQMTQPAPPPRASAASVAPPDAEPTRTPSITPPPELDRALTTTPESFDQEGNGYDAVVSFVLQAARNAKPGDARKSALIDQASLVSIPETLDCRSQRGALLIDLDTGTRTFDLDDPPSPARGLAEQLRAIRGTGTAVVWIAGLPDTDAKQLGTILKATGLDPLGIDPVMLLRRTETRKQQILERADEDWCVLAIAGDRKADFDEVFDYLRNPDGPVAVALEQYIGAGWFIVPPPIK